MYESLRTLVEKLRVTECRRDEENYHSGLALASLDSRILNIIEKCRGGTV